MLLHNGNMIFQGEDSPAINTTVVENIEEDDIDTEEEIRAQEIHYPSNH
jgi:hypothetical protein